MANTAKVTERLTSKNSQCSLCHVMLLSLLLSGSSSLRAYPLLSVITRQPPHVPQVSSPGVAPSHLPLLSPQHQRGSEPSPSQTPLSISSDEDTERSTPRLKKPRRSRTIFTELQLMGLEKKFQKQKYLSTPDRSVPMRNHTPDWMCLGIALKYIQCGRIHVGNAGFCNPGSCLNFTVLHAATWHLTFRHKSSGQD